MSLEARPVDTFTTDNLIIGLSQATWERLEADGSYAAAVDFGILASEELQKEITTLTLDDQASGVSTVAREIVTRLAPSLVVEIFNFRPELAELIFGSTDNVPIVADAAAVVTNDPVQIPTTLPEDTFVPLAHGRVNEASLTGGAVTVAPIVDEIVGVGDGSSGDTLGDFALDFKPLLIGNVTAVTVGGVTYAPIAVGANNTGLEVEIVVGTGATSGQMQFFSGGTQANVTGQILASYAPSFTFANLTDYVIDPLLGRIRFLAVDGATDKVRSGERMLVDYTYVRKAGVTLKPFTRNSVTGKFTLRHIPDIGSNFIWTIPSVSLLLTDDALTFGAEDWVRGTLQISINDAGGTDRFGTMVIASESESA